MNPDGIRFMQRGYSTPDSLELLPAHTIPISVSARLGVRAVRQKFPGAQQPKLEPRRGSVDDGIGLAGAGRIGARLSYLLEVDGNRAGDGPRETRASLQFDDLLSRQRLNLKLGSFDAELPFLSAQRSPTMHPYLAPIDLWARGFELNGNLASWHCGGGLIHSSQSLRTDADATAIRSLEDTYWTLGHQSRAVSVGARLLFDRQDSTLPSLAWMQHLQALMGGALVKPHWAIATAYVFDRFDDRPAAGIHDRHQYYLLETTLVPGSGAWVWNARLEHEYRTRTVWTHEQDHQLVVLNLARVLSPIARLALEGSLGGDNVGGPRSASMGAYVGLQY
ncbi:MAG: hypothetical protein ACRENS_00735 [Candidatus Eiseniibacteriota bacterium]